MNSFLIYHEGGCFIVAIDASSHFTVGLKADGTVVLAGGNKSVNIDVSGWRDIVAIAMGYSHIVGLKSDGTVVTSGSNQNGQCNVTNWQLKMD